MHLELRTMRVDEGAIVSSQIAPDFQGGTVIRGGK